MKKLIKISVFVFLLCGAFSVSAATSNIAKVMPLSNVSNLEISGWIPYWRKATGTLEAIAHIGTFTELNPFGYTVKSDGTLVDTSLMTQDPWPNLMSIAHANKVRIMPSVMWSNADDIDTVLRSPTLRKAHIQSIVDAVNANNFDGIDIDYENKKAETKQYFSLFLRDLVKALGPHKWLSCTIEARTPLDSRFDTIPKDIQYANDFSAINTYCDRVKIMTYDQGTIDLRLNRLTNAPYVPIADPAWVEKVIRLAMQTISKKKIVIGVATYGYEYTVTPLSPKGYVYDRETSFSPNYAQMIASEFGSTPVRNRAGELSLVYMPTSTTPVIGDTLLATTSATVQTGDTSSLSGTNVTSSQGTAAAQMTNGQTTLSSFRLLSWSDASAIQDKINLAKKLGIRGIAIYKIDGGVDPQLWNILKK